MKKLRQFSVSIALALLLGVTAAAGEIHTGIAPTPRTSAQGVTLTDLECDAGAAPAATLTEPSALTEVALDLIRSVLALF